MFVYPQLVWHWLLVALAFLGGVCVLLLASIAILMGRRPSASQREEQRRSRLAAGGRIVDGSLIDADPPDAKPTKIIYTYRIAGVTYQCSQDVSSLGSLIDGVQLDSPVQVRYSRDNPADSIVVAEDWNGLWTNIWRGPDAVSKEARQQSRQPGRRG